VQDGWYVELRKTDTRFEIIIHTECVQHGNNSYYPQKLRDQYAQIVQYVLHTDHLL